MKIHLLTEASRLVTLSIVDLAGYPDMNTKLADSNSFAMAYSSN